MGLTINYRHRTKDFKKIQELIKDMKIFAENTGRYFRTGISEGYYEKESPIKKMDGSLKYPSEKDIPYHFYDSSVLPTNRERHSTKKVWFEIEIKSARKGRHIEAFQMGWFKKGDEWILNDWHKLWGPSGGDSKQVAKAVIEIIGILEYVQKYYFPNLKIDDEFDFHVNYDEKTESQKEFWREILAGKHQSYRRDDGTFPDYKAEYMKLKNHDPKNIFKSMGEMNHVFNKIEGDLAKAGWSKNQIAKDLKIKSPEMKGRHQTSIPVGDKMISELHDTIRNIKIQTQRKRQFTIRKPQIPITKIKQRRKDGVIQNYHKRLGHGKK